MHSNLPPSNAKKPVKPQFSVSECGGITAGIVDPNGVEPDRTFAPNASTRELRDRLVAGLTALELPVKLWVLRFAGARVGVSVYPLAKLAISPDQL